VLLPLAMIGVGAIRSFWIAVPLFLLGAVTFGLAGPLKQTYLHALIPTEQRATIVSFDSLLAGVGSVGGQAGLGYLSQAGSIPAGFVVGGLFTTLAVPLYARLRASHDPADRVTDGVAVEHPEEGIPLLEVAETGD
jgi:MFS family permease